jgi:hypothetical protein
MNSFSTIFLTPVRLVISGLILMLLLSCTADDTATQDTVSLPGTVLKSEAAPESEVASGVGLTVPRPVFQTGDALGKPYPDLSPEAQDFVDFFNKTYLNDPTKSPTISVLGKQDVVWFPPQNLGDTSLEAVFRGPADKSQDCDNPSAYPIVCEDDFSTGEFCQACHDSALFVTEGGLPEMTYYSEYSEPDHKQWLANWSQYGDWNPTIMRLATRDPIWQAQIETETNSNPNVDPAVIQDVCFSCHGAMGERQLQVDVSGHFCTDIFYAVIPGIVPTTGRGKPYPFTGDCAPVQGKSVAGNQGLYAKYGSLARDGVSCEVCHRLGPTPPAGPGDWDGKDFSVFYGVKHLYNVHRRQTENPVPLEYDFTANFTYDMRAIVTPDPVAALDSQPMKDDDYLEVAEASNSRDHVSYLGQSVLCGSCHVLIVPQIPTAFKPGGPLPNKDDYPYYRKPEACTLDAFAPPIPGKTTGNPVTDDCVGLGYEQATYLEWINSDFASEEDNENTCQACHMPLVTDPDDPANHTAIMAQATEGLVPKDYRRHRLMGINLPVFDMFVQFPSVLGVDQYDDRVPDSGTAADGTTTDFIQHFMLNGQMAIVEQATSQANGNGLKPNSLTPDEQAATELRITSLSKSDGVLRADIHVTNNTGHKFPSGAGFRRAFIKFEVLDGQGNVLWVSGQTNPFGAICNGPCVKHGNGSYNLLASEVPAGDPGKLQPHRAVIKQQDQVQIYEVQEVDDAGHLTSRTLSLFWHAKDNRLLPRGWTSPEALGCEANKGAGTAIFGIPQCSAAYASRPQLEPLTMGSTISKDPHYTEASEAGSDDISYQIPLDTIAGTPASVRATMEYQTIPPGFLADRFMEGYDAANSTFLPATQRSIYLTSHLNTNASVYSEHPDNPDLKLSQNWTMSLHQTQSSDW